MFFFFYKLFFFKFLIIIEEAVIKDPLKTIHAIIKITAIAETLAHPCYSFALYFVKSKRASLVVQFIRSLLAMQETQDQSLGWEDPLDVGMAAHSSVLAWKTTWREEPGGLQSMGSQRVGHN